MLFVLHPFLRTQVVPVPKFPTNPVMIILQTTTTSRNEGLTANCARNSTRGRLTICTSTTQKETGGDFFVRKVVVIHSPKMCCALLYIYLIYSRSYDANNRHRCILYYRSFYIIFFISCITCSYVLVIMFVSLTVLCLKRCLHNIYRGLY